MMLVLTILQVILLVINNTVGEMEKIEKCSNTERSEFLLNDKKENIFIPKDKNIPVRACEYRERMVQIINIWYNNLHELRRI